ncbi:MAG: hypothetical protein WC157_00475 [Candidatus Paceibacterota bacterium]
MDRIKKTFLIVLLIFLANCVIFAWIEPQTMPTGMVTPINTSSQAQTKSGSLTIGGDFNVSGKSNICQIVAFSDSGTQAKCPAGYYVTEMVASTASGYMLCCKVNNPLK